MIEIKSDKFKTGSTSLISMNENPDWRMRVPVSEYKLEHKFTAALSM